MHFAPSSRIPALLLSQLLVLAGAFGASPAAADTSTESRFVSLLNEERAAAGHARLDVATDLASVAREHANRMASSNDLHHNPNLGSQVSGWKRVGENVGRGPSVSSIHTAFMNSGSHRANILDARWTEVGVGVAVVDGRIWVTQVFRTPTEPTSATTSDTSGDADASWSPTSTRAIGTSSSEGQEREAVPARPSDPAGGLAHLGTFLRSVATGDAPLPPAHVRLEPYPF